ncbi:MAG: S16 family serine protease [Candidatus Micrarchaeia archaeon]|jgi:predicted S18 family serine protease
MKKEIFILLFITILIFSTCQSGSVQIDVPAVVGGENGGSLAIKINIDSGNGNIYTSIFPKTGISTQSSEENAVISAFNYYNKNLDECNIYFDVVNTLNSKFVDGPSAGAAMAVAVSSVLNDKELRNDVIISGSIDKEGNIGTVGGISEKSLAAVESGKKYFLTPLNSVRYKLIASALEDLRDIKIIDVRTLEEANNIFFQTKGTKVESKINLIEKTEIPVNLTTTIKNKNLEMFVNIGYKMADEFENEINEYINYVGVDSSRYEFLEYFKEEIDIQKGILNKGYGFTSANNIFLQKIDFEFLKKIGEINLETEKEEAQNCLDSFELNEKTIDNWEWLSGSEMRLNWAQDKLDQLPSLSVKRTEGEEYPYLYEILYAKSWCEIANDLNVEGKENKINESNLEIYARNTLLLEQEYISTQPEINSEAVRHLRTAQIAFNKKQYISTIYEVAFAHALQESTSDIFYNINFEKTIDDMYEDNNKSSLWGQVYLTQAKYIYESGDKEDAYTIFKLSNEFEKATNEITISLLNDTIITESDHENEEIKKVECNKIILFFSVIIILESIILIILFFLKYNQ